MTTTSSGMDKEVLTEVDGGVLVITLNRPEARNAIDSGMADGLVEAIGRLDNDSSLRVGVIVGAGSGFSSGMDLKAFGSKGVPEGLGRFMRDGCTKPLIAAIEGFAVAGGLEIALVCDLRVAARGAKLGIPEVKVGLFAGGGGLIRLPNHVAVGVALEMALTGDPISAEEAYEKGLVNKLTDKGEARDAAVQLAHLIARNAPLAVSVSKRILNESQGLTEEERWTLQKPFLQSVFHSDDAKEGPRAFAEKRAPRWTGS